MSISSCPQCAQQISLPQGASHHAKVRCPLCHAQYTLADALASAPPMLEIIEDMSDMASPDGLLSEQHAGATEFFPVSTPADPADEPFERQQSLPLGDLDSAADLEETLAFEAPEIEHDDFVMLEKDTEIEDLDFNPSDPFSGEAPAEHAQPELAGLDEENVLHFEGSNTEHHEPTVPEPAAEDEIALDFGQAMPGDESGEVTEVPFDLDDSQSADEPGEMELDFGASLGEPDFETVASEPELDAPAAASHGDSEEISLDFGEPIEAETNAVAVTDQPAAAAEEKDAKKKKKKEKKEKKPREKSPAAAGRPRSLVGTLVTTLLSAIVAVPLALYGVTWLGPDYDFFKIGPHLPSFMVPPALAKTPTTGRTVAMAPPATQPSASQPAAAPPSEPVPEAADAAEPAPPATEAPPEPEAKPPAAKPEEMPAEEADKALAAPAEIAADADKTDEQPTEGAEIAPEEPSDKPAAVATIEPAEDVADMPAESDDSPAAAVTTTNDQPLTDDKPTGEEMPGDGDKELADTKPADDADIFGDTEKVAKPEEQPAAEAAEVVGPRDAVHFTLADLESAMQAAGAANEQMMAAQDSPDKDAVKKIRSRFYLSLYKLAEVLTFAQDDPSSPQLDGQRQTLEQVVLQFAGDEKRLESLGYNAGKWLAFPKRTLSGIMLTGKVQDIERIGKLYQIKIELGSDAPPVTVVTQMKPNLSSNDRAIVLGSIVERPAERLAGYEGDEALVVWSGMAVQIPAGQ